MTAANRQELNYYEAEYLAKIKETLGLASDPPEVRRDSWRGQYAEHVRFLVNELERMLAR